MNDTIGPANDQSAEIAPQTRLTEGEAIRQAALLDALPARTALLDDRGQITAVNAAWRHFAADNGLTRESAGIGLNYLDVCDAAAGRDAEAGLAAEGIRSVLAGVAPRFTTEYECSTPSGPNWYRLIVAPLAGRPPAGAVVMHLDVTERAEAQHATRHSAELLRAVVDGTPDSVFVKDREGRHLMCNAALARFLGRDAQDIVGKTNHELAGGGPGFVSVAAAEVQIEIDRQILSTGRSISSEVELEGVDGVRTLLVIKSPYRDEHGGVAGVIGIGRDITERKQAEAELQQSQAMLRMASRLAVVGSWHVDLPATRVVWSEVLAEIHEMPIGFSPSVAEAIDFYAPEYRERVRELFVRCASEGTPFDFECELITATGKRVWVHSIGEAVRDGEGNIRRVQGAFQDWSERKRADLEIRQLADRLTSTLESITDGLLSLDTEWRYVVANEQGLRMVGRRREDLIGRVIWTEFPEVVGTVFEANYRLAVLDNVATKFEAFYPPLNTWFSVHCYPSKAGLTLYFRDVTQQRSDQEALRELNADLEARVVKRTEELTLAREGAEQASRAKSAFLAAMSHEIRTPMNGVIGMIDVLEQSSLKRSQLEIVKTVRESAHALLGIVDDVLDFSKIEAGHFQIDHEKMAVAPIVLSVRDTLGHLASSKGVSLHLDIDPALPAQVVGDAARLRQVLINLVGNAIKFCGGAPQPGRVDLRVVVIERGIDACTIDFIVADNGIGMDAVTQSRLFAPFTQGDDSTTKRFGGTGLGLSICSRLVAMMGGGIEVHSELAKGSRFVVRLPFEQAEVEAPGVGVAPAGASNDAKASSDTDDTVPAALAPIGAGTARQLILVAEDNLINQQVIRKQLDLLGYAARVVADGKEALDAIRGGGYALLLSDLHMPNMDGYELAAAVRREEAAGAHLPIIALTANALKGEASRCKEAGMDDYLTKPLQLADLKALLQRWMPSTTRPVDKDAALAGGESQRPAAASTGASTLPAADLRVLIEFVGDDPSVLQGVLEAFGRSARRAAADIRRGVAVDDGAAVAAAAHALKAGARSIGALRLREVCEAMETSSGSARRGELAALLDRFESELAEVLGFLQDR